MLSDGKTAIPITHNFWTSKEFAIDSYKTKPDIAKDLIEAILKHVSIFMILADGLYAVHDFLTWLSAKNIYFETKFHSNRTLEFDEKTISVKKHPLLQLDLF